MPSDVDRILKDLGLEKYAELFSREEVDVDAFWELDDEDLREIGLPLGPRKKLLLAIRNRDDRKSRDQPAGDGGSSREGERVADHHPTERRLLTVLFCDLVRSTELSQALDPEYLRDVLLGYQDRCRQVVERFDGFVGKYMGDGILAYFGYPAVHEDDAERAVRAGLEIVEAVAAYARETNVEAASGLNVRVGVATGPTVVGDLIGKGAARENTVVGETPNLAARLQGLAGPNEVMVSTATHALVGSSVRFESMGEHALKGFADPVAFWRAEGIGLGGGRFERRAEQGFGRFVGRAAELESMLDAWSSTGPDRIRALDIVGEPGIGKSRLVHEFIERLPDGSTVLTGHCSSHGTATTYLPVIDLLQRLFSIAPWMTGDARAAAVRDGLDAIGLPAGSHLPYVLNLLGVPVSELDGVDSSVIGLQTRSAIIEIVSALAKRRPTLVFVNGCHWIDRSSETLLLDLIGAALPNVTVLCTYRPEYEPPWRAARDVREVTLQPLSQSELLVLISARLDGRDVSEVATRQLMDLCQGNPLFAEELARHLRRNERNVGTGLPGGSVPDTLIGLLLQSVNGLSAAARRHLQVGSVMGRTFDIDILRTVLPEAQTAGPLDEALAEGLILPHPRGGGRVYRFKHALLQDAVYGSLLMRDRAELHGAIAEALQTAHSGREVEISDVLARHWDGAGDAAKAAHWCMATADKAFAIFAVEEARYWHDRALKILLDAPRSIAPELFADTVVNSLETLCWQIEYPAMASLAEDHLGRIETDTGGLPVSRLLSWMGDAYINTGELAASGQALTRSLAIAEEEGDPECIAYAKVMLLWLAAIHHDPAAERPDMRDVAAEILDFAEEAGDEYLRTVVHHAMTLELTYAGRLEEAVDWAAQCLERGRAVGYPPAITWSLVNRSCLQGWLGNHDEAVLDCREAARHAESKFDRLMVRLGLASALVLKGDVVEGLAIFDATAEERRGLSMISFMYWPDIVHALGAAMDGDYQRALGMLRRCGTHFRDLGQHRAAAQALLFAGLFEAGRSLGEDHCALPVARSAVDLPVAAPETAQDSETLLDEALALADATGMAVAASLALGGLADLAEASGKADRAAELRQRADERKSAFGVTQHA